MHLAKLNRDEIRSAIERVSQFADERSRAIRVQFTAGEVKIFSSSVETGESEESVPSEYAGPDMEIGFNAQYLLDFLRATNQEQVAFELKDQKSAGELRPVSDGTRGSLPLRGNAHANLSVVLWLMSNRRLTTKADGLPHRPAWQA